MVHQSRRDVVMSSDKPIPLYCVASQHSLSTLYEWSNINGCVGIHSPILYVWDPGMYRCSVTNTDGEKAYSRDIKVTGIVQACTHVGPLSGMQ